MRLNVQSKENSHKQHRTMWSIRACLASYTTCQLYYYYFALKKTNLRYLVNHKAAWDISSLNKYIYSPLVWLHAVEHCYSSINNPIAFKSDSIARHIISSNNPNAIGMLFDQNMVAIRFPLDHHVLLL